MLTIIKQKSNLHSSKVKYERTDKSWYVYDGEKCLHSSKVKYEHHHQEQAGNVRMRLHSSKVKYERNFEKEND